MDSKQFKEEYIMVTTFLNARPVQLTLDVPESMGRFNVCGYVTDSNESLCFLPYLVMLRCLCLYADPELDTCTGIQ